MLHTDDAFQREVAEYAAEHGSHRAHERWPQVPARTARQWRRKFGWVTDQQGRPAERTFTQNGDAFARAYEPFDEAEVGRLAAAMDRHDCSAASGVPEEPYRVSSKTPNECDVERLTTEKVRTLDDLIRVCAIDTDEWEVVSWEAKAYQQGMRPWAVGEGKVWKRETDKPTITQLFSVTAKLKRKVPVISARQEIDALVARAKETITRYRAPLVCHRTPDTGYMLEICLPDLHFGRLSWSRETGGANYDLTIAEAVCREAVATLLARSAHLKFERVLFVVGHDLLNADGNDGKTTKGTPQDNDSRHFKVFQKAREVKVDITEMLVSEVAPVDVVIIPGNHDAESTLHLGDSMRSWFHGERWVTVDCEPKVRKYYDYGQNLIGITHGDKGKPMVWSRVMPNEAGAQWGKTRHREVHCGHLHHESALRDEINGVKVRHLPSLAPPSKWEADEGYVDSATSAEAFHWHTDDGLVGSAVFTKVY